MSTFITGLLDPYIPSPTKPWNKVLVTHLLNRTMFGAKTSDVIYVLGLTPSEAVDLLFQSYNMPDPPGTWINDPPDFNSNLNSQRMTQLRTWWLKTIYEQPVSIREKMTLFWHNHFVSEGSTVIVPQYMYKQNQLLRQHSIGNFRDLAKAVTRDPAMLIYLDGRYNVVGNPNENYARELCELFTMGIGNYTETDIREAARSLTGWILSGLNSVFVPSRHDYGTKTFLGQSGNFDDTDIIDIIFQQQATSLFLAKKLYRFFINQKDNMSYAVPVINELAELIRQYNYDLTPVLKILLKSGLFFSDNIISSLVKSPIDMMMGLIRMFNIYFDPSTIYTKLAYVVSQGSSAGQFILDPPNVQGWLGYHVWLSTITTPVRSSFAESIITGVRKDGQSTGFSVNPLEFALSFPNPNNALALVKDMTEHLIRLPLSPKQINLLLETLLDGIAYIDWNINDPGTPARLKKYLKAVVYLAEFQLN